MKSQTQLLILAVLLVLVIILVSVFSCSNFVPYSSNSLFSRYSKYEGFEANSTNVGSALVNENPEEEEEDEEKKVEGFEGLKPAPFNDDKPLDSFSKTPGSLECEKISSGLSNEKGGLCLSDEQIKSLVTRGGNATVQSKI
jgi:hypothetical protein